jgi:hypothetical protein
VTAVSLHPGVVRTELTRYIGIPKPLFVALALPGWYFTRSAEQGAQTQIYLSASTRITPADGGKYFVDSAPAQTTAEGQNMQLAAGLWELSEKLTAQRFKL